MIVCFKNARWPNVVVFSEGGAVRHTCVSLATKMLFSWIHSIGAMAQLGLSACAIAIILNVYKFFVGEAKRGPRYTRKKFLKRTIEATGISKTVIHKIVSSSKKDPKPVQKKER